MTGERICEKFYKIFVLLLYTKILRSLGLWNDLPKILSILSLAEWVLLILGFLLALLLA